MMGVSLPQSVKRSWEQNQSFPEEEENLQSAHKRREMLAGLNIMKGKIK